MAKVIRMQLARIRPGVHIVPHVDLGGWARHSHRIHVPVVTSDDVAFEVSHSAVIASSAIARTTAACETLALAAGYIWIARQEKPWCVAGLHAHPASARTAQAACR